MNFKKMNVRKTSKGLLAFVLLLALLSMLLVGCGSKSVKATDDAGACGSGVEYSFSATTNKLTISGSGDMQDFAKAEDAPWYAYRAAIEKVVIGENVKSIGDYAFYHCTALEKIEIEATALTSIGKYAFWMNTALEEIRIPNTVTELGESAFAYCTALTAVSAQSLASMGALSFAGCTSLEVATFDGALTAIPEKAFMNCTALTTVAYPESVASASIADDAFLGVNKDKLTVSALKSEPTLTVHYRNDKGESVAESYTEVLTKGASYSVKSPVIEGYTIPAGQETLSGVMPAADLTLTVVYKTIETEPETTAPAPDAAETTEEPDGADVPEQKNPVGYLILLGVLIVAIAVGAFLLLRSSKNVTKDSQTVRKDKSDKKNGKKK